MSEKVRPTYYTDKETHMRLKILAAKTERSITDIIDEAVKTYLEENEA